MAGCCKPIANRFGEWLGNRADLTDVKYTKIDGPITREGVININKEWTKGYNRRYAKAAVSYFPYFFAKTDFLSRKWDTPRMDLATNRVWWTVCSIKRKRIQGRTRRILERAAPEAARRSGT